LTRRKGARHSIRARPKINASTARSSLVAFAEFLTAPATKPARKQLL
jgi:hypothetical protein